MSKIKIGLISGIGVALAAVGIVPLLAFADSGTGSIALTAGSLSETTGAIPTVAAQLNGTDLSKSFTLPVTIIDPTGSGAGWNITIGETAFSGTIGGTPTTLGIDPQVASESLVCGSGSTCTSPTNGVSYPLTVPLSASPAAKLVNAALNTGLGTISSTGTLNITIPANTKVGTYTSTITITIVSGP